MLSGWRKHTANRPPVKILNQLGVCPEADHPYDVRKWLEAPSEQYLKDALTYKGGAYHRICSFEDMKQCLRDGYVVEFGMLIYSSFERSYTAQTGIVLMPQKGEMMMGGHAVLAIGFDGGGVPEPPVPSFPYPVPLSPLSQNRLAGARPC